MKKVPILAVVFSLIFSFTAFSQNIENVQKETTVKKVTVKDTDVKTIVEKEVSEEVATLTVEGTEKVNQSSEAVVIKDAESKSVDVVDGGVNIENQAKLEKQKKEEQIKLEKQKKEAYDQIDGKQKATPVQKEQEILVKPPKKEKKKKSDG
jgi:hypothetical protein